MAVRHVEAVEAANIDQAERSGRQTGKFKKVCTTDPDATMATNGRNHRLEPAYKQHTAVDDVAGIIVGVEVATGEQNEGMAVPARLDAIAKTIGAPVAIATMDAGYAYAKVFRSLEDRKIEGIVPRPSHCPARSLPNEPNAISKAGAQPIKQLGRNDRASQTIIQATWPPQTSPMRG